MTEMTYDRKFIWPKAFFENGHMTERSFILKIFRPNELSVK
jgi:hypothetical protein